MRAFLEIASHDIALKLILPLTTALTIATPAPAADLDFSDPARVLPPPAHAVGFPSRDPQLDVRPGFQQPPPGYGEVAFYWWVGDPLTKERLTWQLDQLASVDGVMGLQINYAHSDRGGQSYGLTYPSEPALFSPAWWDLVGWFMGEAKQRRMAISLSDYTLGVGQGWTVDALLRDRPDLFGSVLKADTKDAEGGTEFVWLFPQSRAAADVSPLTPNNPRNERGTASPRPAQAMKSPLAVTAYRLEGGQIVPGSGIDLRGVIQDGTLTWRVPDGRWRVVAVRAERVAPSLDPMHPQSGAEYAGRFFGQFEDHQPGEGGRGLNFFFSDELEFRLQGHLWTARFADEFRKRKGYDVVPELAALFLDIGPRTPKVRLDFSDVQVALTEEGFFKPVFDWHQQRGMIYGCDHGGRGRNVVEFGDYFRTQRWNQGPGCDQPGLGADIIKNKVASSIAHLYQRPRVWLEGYYGSGWGTSTEQLTEATFRNFVMGQNLLTLHGLYYSTHGGWWEWAPPCNHFRMPYWPHMKAFFACTQRLSYLLSQGDHRCDVAIVYPVAPMEAGLGGNESVQAAFRLGEHLYRQGIDFDFIDFESLARAQVEHKELRVSGERYRVLVLPAMRALRFSTLRKAAELARGGGLVIALGALPEASDRAGREDSELDALVKELFGVTAKELAASPGRKPQPRAKNLPHPSPSHATPSPLNGEKAGVRGVTTPAEDTSSAGKGVARVAERKTTGQRARSSEEVETLIARAFPRDFDCLSAGTRAGKPAVMHRRIGPREVFAVHGAPQGSECVFRATGPIELWDPWTGTTRPLRALAQAAGSTRLLMPLTEKEVQLIVFNQGTLQIEQTVDAANDEGSARVSRAVSDGTPDAPGRTAALSPALSLDGLWEFELKPTMDNRFGDFRWPPTPTVIGAEARQFRYADEVSPNPGWQHPAFDDSRWAKVTASFGPQFWKLGPLPDKADTTALEVQLTQLRQIDPAVPVEFGGQKFPWQPYAFSWRWGLENDPGHQGYHGLKEEMHDEFIGLGKRRTSGTGTSYEREEAGSCYYLWTSVPAASNAQATTRSGGLKPAAVWLNHARLIRATGQVQLQAGSNPLLLRYDSPGRSYFVLQTGDAGVSASDPETFSPAAAWIWTSSDDRAAADRFLRKAFTVEQIPTQARLRITCDNGYVAFLNGREVGRGNRWEVIQEYDVATQLRPGTNVLAIAARNDGDAAGLIAEIRGTAFPRTRPVDTLSPTGGEGRDKGSEPAAKDTATLVATDATWLWAPAEENGWREAGFNAGHWAKVHRISSFEDSLWATHPNGPPRVDAPVAASRASTSGSLAMTWHNQPGLLPFDVRPQDRKPAGLYRFTAPPGLRAMTLIARGTVQGWADGQALEIEAGKPRLDGSTEFKVTLPQPIATPAQIALRIEQQRGGYGGAALPEPIALECAPGHLALGDWAQIDGLACYSGGAWYRKLVALTAAQLEGRVELDLGSVVASAEIHVNGRRAGIRVAAPWKLDITPLVKAGENRLEALVYNTLANHYVTIPTRYRGSTVSGLLGPVSLRFSRQSTETKL